MPKATVTSLPARDAGASAMDAYNEATLKLDLTEGVLTTVSQCIEDAGDEGVTIACSRDYRANLYLTLESAIHHLRDARKALEQVPARCLLPQLAQAVRS